jgi:TPR repeat protein
MRILALGLALSCAIAGAEEPSVLSGFIDAIGLAKSKVIDRVLPETVGAKAYREGMKLRYSQPLDTAQAFKLFKQGYEAGSANCAYELSVCYLRGVGVRMSRTSALEVLSKGVLLKDGSTTDCELLLIQMKMRGELPLDGLSSAQECARRLIQLSSHDVAAASMLTQTSWNFGTPPQEMVTEADRTKALDFLKALAATGNAQASFECGKLLIASEEAKEREEGLRLIKHAESKGVFGAQLRLHDYYEDTEVKPATAFEWLEKGWAAGDCRAGASLSFALIRGKGTVVDKKRAVEIAMKVGEQGDAYATYNVADSFTGYTGFDPSLSNFITWHKLAAEKGNGDSAEQLGTIYAGEEVVGFKVSHPVSVEDAFTYFQMAAYPDGDSSFVYRLNALLYLGDMYRRGIGCEADPAKAAKAYLDYLALFQKNNYSKNDRFEKGGKVRLLWLKKHYPNLPDIPGLDDPRLKFDEVGDFLHSFKHFAKVEFDYELFDEIAGLMPDRGIDERKMFTQACTYVARNYGAKDALFHFGDIKYGKEFNLDSYEWYKHAALSGSPSAARRLHSMLRNHSNQRSGKSAKQLVLMGPELGPEYALKLWEKSGEIGVAGGEAASWRAYATELEEDFNRNRTKKRDFRAIAARHDFFTGYGDSGDPVIMRMIYDAQREQLAKDAARLAKEAAER